MNQDAVKVPLGNWADQRLAKLNGKDLARHNSESDSGFDRDLRRWVGKKEVLPSNVLNIPLVGKNFGHPAVFPAALPAFFIKLLAPAGGMVLDPFGGSGTTAIAALELGRQSVVVDSNLKYCIVAVNRIQRELGQQSDESLVSSVNFKSPSLVLN